MPSRTAPPEFRPPDRRPGAGDANWVFFAFTYDGTSAAANANFYFGSPTQAAALDSTFDYDQGPVTSLGRLSVGNFSPVDAGARNGTGNGGGSRVFRGLMDELNVFSKVLTLTKSRTSRRPRRASRVQEVALTASLQGNQFVDPGIPRQLPAPVSE